MKKIIISLLMILGLYIYSGWGNIDFLGVKSYALQCTTCGSNNCEYNDCMEGKHGLYCGSCDRTYYSSSTNH